MNCANPKCDNALPRPEAYYCGWSCYIAHRHELAWAGLPDSKECSECGETFYPRENDSPQQWRRRKACSEECQHDLRSRNGKAGGSKSSRQGVLNKAETYLPVLAYRLPATVMEENQRRAEAEYARYWHEEGRSYAHG